MIYDIKEIAQELDRIHLELESKGIHLERRKLDIMFSQLFNEDLREKVALMVMRDSHEITKGKGGVKPAGVLMVNK